MTNQEWKETLRYVKNSGDYSFFQRHFRRLCGLYGNHYEDFIHENSKEMFINWFIFLSKMKVR